MRRGAGAPFTGMRPSKAASHRYEVVNSTTNLAEVAA
jgi:hypothetical protein